MNNKILYDERGNFVFVVPQYIYMLENNNLTLVKKKVCGCSDVPYLDEKPYLYRPVVDGLCIPEKGGIKEQLIIDILTGKPLLVIMKHIIMLKGNLNYYIQVNGESLSPLLAALKVENYKIAEQLIGYGANINCGIKGSYRNAFELFIAENSGNLSIYKFIISYGININKAILVSLIVQNRNDLLRIILKSYANYNKHICDMTGVDQNLLEKAFYSKPFLIDFDIFLYMHAAVCNNAEALSILLEYDERNRCKVYDNLLRVLTYNNYGEIKNSFLNLVQSQDNKTLQFNKKYIAYITDVRRKRDEILNLIDNNQLSELKSYITKNEINFSALSDESFDRNIYDLNVDERLEGANDILIYCIENNYSLKMIEFIASQYLTVNYCNARGITPLMIALKNDNYAAADVLLKHGAFVEFRYKKFDLFRFLYELQMSEKNGKVVDKAFIYAIQHGLVLDKDRFEYIIYRDDVEMLKKLIYWKYWDEKNTHNDYSLIKILLSLYKYQKTVSKRSLWEVVQQENYKVSIPIDYYKIAFVNYSTKCLGFLLDNNNNPQIFKFFSNTYAQLESIDSSNVQSVIESNRLDILKLYIYNLYTELKPDLFKSFLECSIEKENYEMVKFLMTVYNVRFKPLVQNNNNDNDYNRDYNHNNKRIRMSPVDPNERHYQFISTIFRDEINKIMLSLGKLDVPDKNCLFFNKTSNSSSPISQKERQKKIKAIYDLIMPEFKNNIKTLKIMYYIFVKGDIDYINEICDHVEDFRGLLKCFVNDPEIIRDGQEKAIITFLKSIISKRESVDETPLYHYGEYIVEMAMKYRRVGVLRFLLDSNIFDINKLVIRNIIDGKLSLFNLLIYNQVDFEAEQEDNSSTYTFHLDKNEIKKKKLSTLVHDFIIYASSKDSGVILSDSEIVASTTDILRKIVPHYFNLNSIDKDDRTLISYYIINCDTEMTKAIMDIGVEASCINSDNKTFYSALKLERYEILDYFLERGLDINSKDRHGETLLNYALYSRSYNSMKYLINRNADVKCLNKNISVLRNVIIHNQLEILKYLFNLKEPSKKKKSSLSSHPLPPEERIIDINVEDGEGLTLLNYAIDAKKIDMIKYLIENGANIEAIYENVRDLYSLVDSDEVEIIEYLLNHGMDIDFSDGDDPTLLMYAVDTENQFMTQFLIDHGANTDELIEFQN